VAEEDERAEAEAERKAAFREQYLRAAQQTEYSAIDHIMSFAHTEHAIARNRNDWDRLATTPLDFNINEGKAEDLAGTIVIPTSDTMTVGYWLKGFLGRATQSKDSRLRSGGWQRELLTIAEANGIIASLSASDESIEDAVFFGRHQVGNWVTFGKSLIDRIVKFDEGDNNFDYRLAAKKPDVDTTGQSVWIPGIADKLQLPSNLTKGKSGARLKERLEKLRTIVKPIKRDTKAGELLKPNPITPLTEYYLMRYLAPWLVSQGYVEQALPRLTEDRGAPRSVLGRINVDRTQLNEEFDSGIAELVQTLVAESKTPIDEMFAFERMRTTYTYPSDYPNPNHIAGRVFIKQPDPKTEDLDVDYGILQQIYASMTPANRKSFVKQTKRWVLDTMPKTRVHHYSRGSADAYSPTLGRGRTQTYLPTGADKNLSYAEAALVWLEETRDERAFQSEYSLGLPTNLGQPTQKEQMSEGATIVVPGVILLLAEKADEHSLYDSVSEANTIHIENIDEMEGYDYLAGLMEITQRPGLISGLEPEQAVEIQSNALEQILASEYEVLYQPINEQTARLIHQDGGVVTTLTVNPKVLSKAVPDSELQSKLEEIGATEYGKEFLNSVLQNMTLPVGEGEDTGTGAYALETGLQMRKPRKFGAKAFNALGYLMEDQMIRSAQQAARTTQMPKSSDFDKMVAALIGSPKHPGLAVSHAALHYQKLYVQMRSPVKNWDIVEKSEFEEGTFLSLTTFLESPAEKALYWMLNETGFISVGNFTGERPTFFEVPRSKASSEAQMTGLQNAFATVVIGYYRLLFSQIRQRMVFTRSGKEGAKATPETIDLNKYWKSLMLDASRSPPNSAMFGLVLRFFSQSEAGVKPIIQIPTWMPVMPSDLRQAKNVKTDPKSTLNYLKWAYGTDPVSLELFAEISAAYHTAKALSEFEDYSHMVERFVSAVVDDKGAPFLFAILYSNDFNLSSETIQGTPVSIVNFMGGGGGGASGGFGARPRASSPKPGKSVSELRKEVMEKVEGVVRGPDTEKAASVGTRRGVISNIEAQLGKLVEALQNADSDESVNAAFEVISGYAVNVPEELDGVNLRDEFVAYVAERKAELERFDPEELAERIDKAGFVPPGTLMESDIEEGLDLTDGEGESVE